MSDSADAVSIRVLDREYTVGVRPGERDSLLAAARLLDQQMREIRGANRMAAIDRVAILAALNFAHELQLLRDARKGHDRELAATIGELQRKLDTLLGS